MTQRFYDVCSMSRAWPCLTLHPNADPFERNGYRNGYRPRQLKTRVGTPHLLIPGANCHCFGGSPS